MLTYVFSIIALAASFALLGFCLAAGLRNGDRPGDATVTAVLAAGTQPDEARPVIVVTVRNPAGGPVLVALSARRALIPSPLAEPHGVSVPRLTRRGRFRPGRYETVGVVPAGGAAELALPVAALARSYLLTAVAGQQGSRLRVHRLRIGPATRAAGGRDELPSAALNA